MSPVLVVLRSIVFLPLQAALTIVWSIVSLLTFPFRPIMRYRIITVWSRIVVWLAQVICGIGYEVRGLENLPQRPSIVLAKHQSAWETIAFQVFLPPQVWVLRRSLLWVPFFGWGLAMMSPIAIDRSAGVQALKQTLEQGRDRLAQGFWIIIFPKALAFRRAKGADTRWAAPGWQYGPVHRWSPSPIMPVTCGARTRS